MAKLDLDALLPDPHVVVFRGVEYELPGEIPLPMIMESVRLQDKMIQAATAKEQVDLLERMYEIVMELFRDANPEVSDLRLSPREIGRIIGFVASNRGGQTSLELAIVEGLTGEEMPDDEEREAEARAAAERGEEPPDAVPPSEGTKATVSRSRKRSPAKS